MKKALILLAISIFTVNAWAQTNTAPLPSGNTKIGGHLTVGASNEVWTDASSLYFNYRGNANATHFWNLAGASGKPIMSLLKNGNVGIGTASPTSKLTVKGGVSIDGANTISSVNGFHNFLQLQDPSHAAIVYNPGQTNELMFGFHSNGSFYWGSGQNAGNDYAMYLSKNGNLGITGKFTANEVEIKVGGWADFVFEDDYNLMPLNELGTYIQQNKHLPEIPTTAEVQENGISVGEMNAKLLQKVEELTLYTLEQQKIIESLLNRVETLETK